MAASSDALIGGTRMAATDAQGVYRFPALPVGSYVFEAFVAGFLPLRQEGLRILANRTLGVDFVLQPSTVRESITVTAVAPRVSVIDTRVATSFDTGFIDSQPLKRSFYNIFKAAPGANLDYRLVGNKVLAYGATSETQNAFTIDGINMANSADGGQWVGPSIQWMEEIQVGGLGANAEHGGYTGGVLSAVTKSGGNDTHGRFELHHQPSSWVSDNDPGSAQAEFKVDDYAAHVGGRVVRDRIWYFVGGEYIRDVATPYRALDTIERDVFRGLGKLTVLVDESNRVSLVAEHDRIDSDRLFLNRFVSPEAAAIQVWRVTSATAGWESHARKDSLANVRVGGYDGRSDFLPYRGFETPGRVDVESGLAWVNQTIRQLNRRRLVTADASWSRFADGLLGGSDSHAFKFGGNYEVGSSSDEWLRNGGFTYFDDSSSCASFDAYLSDPTCGRDYVERGWGEFDSHPEYDGFALFVQDSLRLERVTLNAGLRYGDYRGGWQAGHGAPEVFDASYLDPRIGLAWDVRGDARSALKAHWGRYHEKIYGYLFDREASGRAAIPDMDCFWNESTEAYDSCAAPVALWARMGTTGLAYVDESLLSFEQQVGAEVLIGIDLLDRRFRDLMALINANQDYELLAAPNPLAGGTIPVWNLLTPQDWVLTTDNSGYRDFRSATLRLDKRHGHGWSGRASVVYTDFDGNVLANNGYAREFTDRNGLYNADGRMGFAFNEWEIKLSGDFDLPWGFSVSGQYAYLSGWYWAPYGRIADLDYNWLTGRDVNLLPRGSEQLPGRQLLDLRLAWTPRLAESIDLTLTVDVFNAFNSDTVLNVQDRWGLYQISRGTWTPRADFGTATQIETPREIRAGLRLDF